MSLQDSLVGTVVTFGSGAAYGFTSVAVGQPLDTLKTIQQVRAAGGAPQQPLLRTALDVIRQRGLLALYAGSAPMIIGGVFMRSAQFGFNDAALATLEARNAPKFDVFGLSSHVLVAGVCGGFGRALIEGPAEFVKIRQQLPHAGSWRDGNVLSGCGVTVLRNCFLFTAFVTYNDVYKRVFPEGLPGGAFVNGAVCSNLAWLTFWPLDVIKTQRQSGLYAGQSALQLLSAAAKSKTLYAGLVPGLVRSTIANGSAMVVYKHTQKHLNELLGHEGTGRF